MRQALRHALRLERGLLIGIALCATGQAGPIVLPVARAAESDPSPADTHTEYRITANVAASAQVFHESGELPGQADGRVFPFLEGTIRFDSTWNDGRDRFTLQPYARWDIRTDRDLLDVQDAYYLHTADAWDTVLGIHTVFWGVVESRHLVNIINQVDGLGDVDQEDWLGQPMLNLNLFSPDYGNLGLYGLLGFREREFPSVRDRLRMPTPVDDDNARFEKDGFARNAAFAMRYSNVFDLDPASLDLALSYFYGTGREPRLIPSGDVLIPFYDTIDQVGLEGLLVVDDWQFKYEGIWRSQAGEEFAAGVAGFEYTMANFLDTGADVGLLGEYLFDDRSPAMPPTLYDRDVFLGLRVSGNDVRNTYLLAGFVLDTRESEQVFRLEFNRLLTDDLQLEVEAHAFIGFGVAEPGFDPDQDSYIMTRLRTFF